MVTTLLHLHLLHVLKAPSGLGLLMGLVSTLTNEFCASLLNLGNLKCFSNIRGPQNYEIFMKYL